MGIIGLDYYNLPRWAVLEDLWADSRWVAAEVVPAPAGWVQAVLGVGTGWGATCCCGIMGCVDVVTVAMLG